MASPDSTLINDLCPSPGGSDESFSSKMQLFDQCMNLLLLHNEMSRSQLCRDLWNHICSSSETASFKSWLLEFLPVVIHDDEEARWLCSVLNTFSAVVMYEP